jgi:soluble lytic murein transglycosylase
MSVTDPVGQKLVEWALLRHAESEARFERYATFIKANPDWPSIPLLRQRAEMRLQQPRYRPARGFLGGEPTGSVNGHSLTTRGIQERDERWRERRGLARRLIDLGEISRFTNTN